MALGNFPGKTDYLGNNVFSKHQVIILTKDAKMSIQPGSSVSLYWWEIGTNYELKKKTQKKKLL